MFVCLLIVFVVVGFMLSHSLSLSFFFRPTPLLVQIAFLRHVVVLAPFLLLVVLVAVVVVPFSLLSSSSSDQLHSLFKWRSVDPSRLIGVLREFINIDGTEIVKVGSVLLLSFSD